MTNHHICPVCGYAELTDPPRAPSGGGSYEICWSCGFQFGVSDDDRGWTYETWRARWVEQGMPWSAEGIHPTPVGWDPAVQLGQLLKGNG